jgi:hypothetical protein
VDEFIPFVGQDDLDLVAKIFQRLPDVGVEFDLGNQRPDLMVIIVPRLFDLGRVVRADRAGDQGNFAEADIAAVFGGYFSSCSIAWMDATAAGSESASVPSKSKRSRSTGLI